MSLSQRWLPGLFALAAAAVGGCHGSVGGTESTGTAGTTGSPGSAGTSGSGTAGTSGTGTAGAGGAAGDMSVNEAPCTGASDARLVPAPQRVLRLTMLEYINEISALVDTTIGGTFVGTGTNAGAYGNIGDETLRQYPPLDSAREGPQIDDTKFLALDGIATLVMQYIATNFTTITKCPATPTDACATTYLNALAAKAYRRPLATAEQTRLTALYTGMKSMSVNGYTITSTIQEATQYAAYAILSTPQLLYRSELGDTTATASTSPPGIPLTQYEIASELSFFLTDNPPDATLLAAAQGGTLTGANLTTQTTRLLGTPTAQTWLKTIMFTFYKINLLYNVINVIDTTKFPNWNSQLAQDMHTESDMFLNNVLWNGKLTDLATSTTTFLNTNLAQNIYMVPAPSGATATNFVQATLPSAQRTGMLTNAGFLTSRARSDTGSVVARGLVIHEAMLCMAAPPKPTDAASAAAIAAATAMLATETTQQQVATRAGIAFCAGCHSHFDAYGLVLENFDNIGTWRTMDENGFPVDAHATLPAEAGGGMVNGAIDFAQMLVASPSFTNCLTKAVLQYALTDLYTAPVDVPSPAITSAMFGSKAGCAVADMAQRYTAANSSTFSDMVRTAVTTPAFSLRTPSPL